LTLSEETFFSNLSEKIDLMLIDKFGEIYNEKINFIKSKIYELENTKRSSFINDFNFLYNQLYKYLNKFNKNFYNNTNHKNYILNKETFLYSKGIKEHNKTINESLKKSLEGTKTNIDDRFFYFRKQCLFNKNHAIHTCYEFQLGNLDKLNKKNFLSEVDQDNVNFFLPVFEKDYNVYLNENSLKLKTGCNTTRNNIHLKDPDFNFFSKIRKSVLIEKNNNKVFKNFNQKVEEHKIKYLICILCKMVYSSESILMYCDFCSIPYYTCVIENDFWNSFFLQLGKNIIVGPF